jgi:hypothetical protein
LEEEMVNTNDILVEESALEELLIAITFNNMHVYHACILKCRISRLRLIVVSFNDSLMICK